MMIIQFALVILLGGKPQTNIADYSFLAVLGMYADFFFRAGGQEELGFRGFALPKLQEKFSPIITSLIIGASWFSWHLPLYIWVHNVPQHGQSLLFGLLFQISICFTFTWIYNSTQSILFPMLLHATINFLPTVLVISVSGSLSELISWIALIVPNAALGVWLVWRDGSRNTASPSLNLLVGSETN